MNALHPHVASRAVVVGCLALLCVGAGAQAPAESGDPGADPVVLLGESPIAALLERLGPDVTIYDTHVTTLSNPFFEGRQAGTRGNELASEYLRFQFESYGLRPAFPEIVKAADGTEVITPHASYFQRFDPAAVGGWGRRSGAFKLLGKSAGLRVGEGAWAELIPDLDFTVLGCSGSGEVEGTLVFCGYSITSGPGDYLNFPPDANLDGKIAVVLRFEPMKEDGTSRWVDEGGAGWSFNAALEPKISAAARRGAEAVIVVNPPGAKDERATRLATAEETGDGEFEVPVIMVSGERADFLLSAADREKRSLAELRRLADEGPTLIDMPGASVRIGASVDRSPTLTANVGGWLEGRGDLAGEIVVVGAHFDHVGYGRGGGAEPGKIHPGADDNASGTSAMLQVARRMSERYASLPEGARARSVLFLGFSAEEMGLLGSRYYCDNPVAPIDRHVFMLNMDMVGRVRDETIMVGGVETGEGLSGLVDAALTGAALKQAPLPQGVFGRSDHASFHAKEMPVLFFFSGFHDDYHAPGDIGARINRVGAVRVANVAEEIAWVIASQTAPPAFIGEQQASDAPPSGPPGGQRRNVRFGIRPGYDANGRGVLVEEVFADTPAASAGLAAGDQLIGWNGKDITGVEDWTPLLRQAKPGDKIEIVYLRDGKEQRTMCELLAPASGG